MSEVDPRHLAAAIVGVVLAASLGAFSRPTVRTVFGQKLNKVGERAYHHLDKYDVEQG